MNKARVLRGDCREVMAGMKPDSVDAIVTDPPYGLTFMGKGWDRGVPGVEFWTEALRVAKPGAHLLAFGGTRTHHLLMCAIEDAGWEIRDCVMWVYGSGFPKSHNLKGEREGWGTALKPAWEPIIVARKPLAGTVAENVMRYGAGAINVDGCRVGSDDGYTKNAVTQGINTARTSCEHRQERRTFEPSSLGRWPANLIHDGSQEVLDLFPSDAQGSAARFFYCAKAGKKDRDEGCEGLAARFAPTMGNGIGGKEHDPETGTPKRNTHPTVKPTDLMRYLCRLVTPPGGVVLDPFCGSGSTGKAAVLEGFDFIGIELSDDYADIAERRIANADQ